MKISQENKSSIEEKCQPLVEQFREKYISENPNKEFNYLIGVHLKWYRHYLYFCELRRRESPDGKSHRDTELKFVRLEYLGRDSFNFSYFRHTGQWFLVARGLTLADCFEMMKGNQNFHPM